MKFYAVLILSLLFAISVQSQQMSYKKDADKTNANYYEIVAATRAQIAKTDLNILSNKKAQKQFERWAYYWKDRVYADGSFPSENLGYFNAGILDEKGMMVNNPLLKSVSNSSWVNIGPQNVPDHNGYPNYPQMGRLNSLLRFAHPTNMNQDVLFVGAPTGGLWKSTDGGSNWTPILDYVSGIGITDIASAATSYSSNTVIYVSTGDYDSDQLKSIGVLKSTDGGNTFQSTDLSFPLSEQEVTSNLIVLDDNTVVVGTTHYILKTYDGGINWYYVLYDEDMCSFGRFQKNNDDEIVCMNTYGDVYFSTDYGDNWLLLREGENYPDNKVAMNIDDEYLDIVDINGQLSYFDFENIEWIQYGNPVPTYDAQGGYNQTMVIENNMVIIGGMNGYHSTDWGETWYKSLNGYWENNSSPGSYIHSDYHSMGKLDDNPNTYKYWACHDGGLSYIDYEYEGNTKPEITYKSEGCIVTQLYSVAITPNSTAGNMLQGNQDNDGFSREMHNGSMQWIAVGAGDGTATAIDYTNPSVRYLGSQNGRLIITESGFSGNYQGDLSIQIPGAAFVWPLEMNTVDHNKLYAGGDDVYLLDAENESNNALNAGTGQVSFISTHNNAVFAIGDNAMRKSLNGGQTWSTINQASSNPSAKINSIDFYGTTPNYVYATVGSYINGQKVFVSDDGGQTWYNISDGLPNILMKEILVAQNEYYEDVLYLATELGVYYKMGNEQWTKLGGSTLPNVIVNDIDINYTENVLVAATFGRGLWQIDISEQVGFEDNEFADAQKPVIYPNPVIQNTVHLKLPGYDNQSHYSYLIYNVVGGVIKEGRLSGMNTEIDLSSIPNGIYMIKISNGSQQGYVEKIIKN